MNHIWSNILLNKEWLFSGIGVVVLSLIGRLIFKRKQATNTKITPHGSGNNYAAETINIHNSNALSMSDVKELAMSVFKENFPKLQEIARIEAERNRDLFINELDDKIHEKLNLEEINRFNKPDVQFALKDAIISASRKNNGECHTILSNLIIDRVKNDGVEFKEIVYNEAIGTIPRLTKNHLDILAFTFITKYALFKQVSDWTIFDKRLRAFICPVLNFSNSPAQFQHLEYSDCANMSSFGTTTIESKFLSSYSNLFFKEEKPFIDKKTFEKLKIPISMAKYFFQENQENEKYYFIHHTTNDIHLEIDRIRKEGGTISDFTSYFSSKIKSGVEANADLKNKLEYGNTLLSKFNDTDVNRLTLTSVGIVLGASHIETYTGEKLNIDIWIN